MNENVIEWLDGQEHISVTFSQRKWVNRIERLALTDENIEILARNPDGSIFAHLPISYLKLSPKRKDNLSAERKSELADMMRKLRRGTS